jgi:hypothetical protein
VGEAVALADADRVAEVVVLGVVDPGLVVWVGEELAVEEGLVGEDVGVAGDLPPPPPPMVSEPMVVVPDWLEPPTSAATGFCPISSTAVITPMASANTATTVAATADQRSHRRRAGLRRGLE